MSAYGVKAALILEAIHINISVWARIIVLDLPSGFSSVSKSQNKLLSLFCHMLVFSFQLVSGGIIYHSDIGNDSSALDKSERFHTTPSIARTA